jgi:dienelactone hydrolase
MVLRIASWLQKMNKKIRLSLGIVCLLGLLTRTNSMAQEVRHLTTENGVEFGLWGGNAANSPAPVLFVLGSTIDQVLGSEYFRQAGNRLAKEQAWLCVSLDLPYHGKMQKKGEPKELEGWAYAAKNKEDFVAVNNSRMKDILDYLIQKGFADSAQINVCGTSRGGYLSYQFAAYEPRVKAVAGFSPVTNLLALREFNGMKQEDFLPTLILDNKVDLLTKKAVWFAIGDRDERVNTDFAVELARKISKTADGNAPAARVELNVMKAKGHTTPKGAPDRAVDWFLNK